MRQSIKNKTTGFAVLLAAVLALSAAAEWLYSAVTQKDPADYPRTEYTLGAFEAAGFEAAAGEDSAFTALANDACFRLKDVGGIRAENIDLLLRREAGDATEMVVYFTGRSNGVEGTFVAGIKQTGEGRCRASAAFDRIDSLEIYPTETTGASVWFAGIECNRELTVSGFSVFRLPLWGFLFAAASALFRVFRAAAKKERQRGLWLKIYWILGAGIALFAFAAGGLYTFARQLGSVLIPLSLAAFSLLYGFIWFTAVKVKRRHHRVFLLFLFAAAAFAFATAPLQAPDEAVHFARSYAIASGSFGFDGDFRYPGDMEWLYHSFPGELGNRIAEGDANALTRLTDYLSASKTPFPDESAVFSNAMLILPYLPSALGILVIRLFGGNALFALFAGRLMNALTAALAAAFAVKKAERFQTPLLTVIFFPLTAFMAASLSYDSMLLAALFLFFGMCCRETVRPPDFLLMAAAFAVIVMIKPLYLLLAPAALLIPRGGSPLSKRANVGATADRLLPIAALLAAGILLWQLSLLYADLFARNVMPAPALPRTDKAAQLQYILKNPLSFAATAVVDGFRKNFYLGEFGLFGHLDLPAPLTSLFAIPAAAVSAALAAGENTAKGKDRGEKKNAILCGVMAVGLFFAIAAAFYIQDSVVGSSTILGIQARYFIPSVFFVSALGSFFFGKFLRPRISQKPNRTAVLWLPFAVTLLAALETLFGYYL